MAGSTRKSATAAFDLTTGSALVSVYHDVLKDKERRFTLGGRSFRIQQGWKPDGRGGTELGFGNSNNNTWWHATSSGRSTLTNCGHTLKPGASVYPCAIVLAHYIMTHPEVVAGRSVLELGAGVGLVGIAAAAAGAASVVISDGDDKVLRELTQGNVDDNLSATERATVHVHQHLWYDDVLAHAVSLTIDRV